MTNRIVYWLKHKKNNPRNSEGAFITLGTGEILYAYSQYDGQDWHDNASAVIASIVSSDGGFTWSKKPRILVENEGGCNVMSPSLLRLGDGRIALFYLRKNSLHDCRLYMRTSVDEGVSWGDPSLCIPAPGYFVVNNDRVVRLKNGRIVIPAAYHRPLREDDAKTMAGVDWRAITLFYFSDDDGVSWEESLDWWGLPVRNKSGMQEPGIVEMTKGRLYAWARTDAGRQWHMFSKTFGKTWCQPRPSKFRSPCSALSIKRNPATGDWLAVWNDHRKRWLSKEMLDHLDDSWGRTPLVMAVSRDHGRSWSKPMLLENDPHLGFCYTAIHFTERGVLLAYCCGGNGSGVLQDSCIRFVGYDVLYEHTRD